MTVDWSINFGNVLTIIGFIAGALAIFFQMRAELRVVNNRLQAVETSLKSLAEILTKVAEQKARIEAHASRLERLERQIDEKAA